MVGEPRPGPRMATMNPRSIALLTCLPLACAAPPNPAGPALPALAETAWTLARIDGKRALHSPEISLIFADDRVVGSAGVNRYFGSWSTDGSRLSFIAVGATRRVGPPVEQAHEDRYLAALTRVDGARLAGEDLVLTGGGEDLLTFTPR